MLKKLIAIATGLVGVFMFVAGVQAAQLKNAYVTLSSPLSAATSVAHRFYFVVPGTTSNLAAVRFQYCVNPSGTAGACSNTGGGLDGATLNDVEESNADDVTNWYAGTWQGTYYMDIGRTSADTNAGGNVWEFEFTGATNPTYSTCTNNPPANGSTGTCYVRITTYSDTVAGTASDTSVISMTVTRAVSVTATVDPSFTLSIAGVDPALTATANGTTLTGTVTSTITTIPFGNMTPGTEKFAAQSATVTTNAYGGYSISVNMNANLVGTAYGDDIDPFTGNSASTILSAAWLLPTGTTSGTNTGWLGVGTDDTDVVGQGGTNSNQFYSLGTSATTVSSQSTSAQSELDIYVYGLEVNSYQRADSYSGSMRYNALPVY